MIYLSISEYKIKTLSLKKTLLGQEEVSFFEKKYEAKLLEKGQPINDDLLASAIKETLTLGKINDKNIFLILPQEVFNFFRTDVPNDIAPSALKSFVNDKARSQLTIPTEDLVGDYFLKNNNEQKVVNFYGLSQDLYSRYQKIFSLIELKIENIIPETIAYYKLFEKTLRSEKKEIILYLHLEKNYCYGYLYDNFGLIDEKKFSFAIKEEEKIEHLIKELINKLSENQKKPNRLIISGEGSENIRQDTFTKAVGVWTNPLKRIIPNFYDQYLKLLIVDKNKPFPILNLDICFAGFIFNKEEKFSLGKITSSSTYEKKSLTLPKITIKKELIIFIASFALSFGLFVILSQIKNNQIFTNKKTVNNPTPTIELPSPTPTPSFKKEELKIEVLNGSGVPGKASEMKKILKEKGYQEIITGNAENFNYKKTEIKVKKDKYQALLMLKNDLKEYLNSFDEGLLEEKETADVIITFGSDFK